MLELVAVDVRDQAARLASFWSSCRRSRSASACGRCCCAACWRRPRSRRRRRAWCWRRADDGSFGLRGLPAEGRQAAARRARRRGSARPAALGRPEPTAVLPRAPAHLRRPAGAGGPASPTTPSWRADAELTLRRLVDGVAARLAFELDQAGAPATVLAEAGLEAATGRVSFAVGFADLSAAPSSRGSIRRCRSQGVDLPLSGRITGDAILHGATWRRSRFEVRAGERRDRAARPAGAARCTIGSATVQGEIAADLAGRRRSARPGSSTATPP